MTWKLTSKLTVQGHGTITLDDFGVATGGMPDASELAHSKIARAVGEVLNNPWENVHIEKVESVFTVDYSRELTRVRGIDLLDPVVDVGQNVRIRVHLVPFIGPETTQVVEMRMPDEMAGKEVEIELVPGYAVQPELPAPQNLSDLLANETKQSLTPRSLVLQYRAHAQGVAYKGHVADRLPAFAADLLRPSSTDVSPEAFASYTRVVVPLDKYIEGGDRTRIKVRPLMR